VVIRAERVGSCWSVCVLDALWRGLVADGMRSSVNNLWLRRHLLWVLTSSNVKRQSKNTVLGYLWWLLDPILMTAVYYLLVAVLFRRGGSNQPYLLFLLCGLLSFKAFSDSVGQSVHMLTSQAAIIRSIAFPKAVLPLSIVLSNAVFLAVALLVAVGLAIWYGPEYGTWPGWTYVLLPVVIGLQVLFTAGLALVVSALGVLFKDTGNIVGHVLRMWYFLSPGLYSLEQVPEQALFAFRLNPFSGLMTAYRDILMRGQVPAWTDLAYAGGIGLLTCLLGFWLFRRLEGRLVQNL
jgi:lipopolysaccharide transport system permease protein/teichoic acid transport system permease protein